MIKGPIYFDFASSTPVNEQVYEAMAPYFLSYFGNASSSTHMQGELASKAVVNAKSQISKLVNCKEDEVFFTSGSTESIKLACCLMQELLSIKQSYIILLFKQTLKYIIFNIAII